MTSPTLAFVAAETEAAEAARAMLEAHYGAVAPEAADAIVALGGDGLMLQTLHRFMHLRKPIYGMLRGSVGFLLNAYREDDLPQRIANAQSVTLYPLAMIAHTAAGTIETALAINEVSLLRQTRQAARLAIAVDGRERLRDLVCDGILVSTPAGSTAYNLSAHGPILPLGAGLLAVTPISAFRPRRWRGALLPHRAKVEISVLEGDKRPVSATADHTEVRDVVHVSISEDRSRSLILLFDPEHSLEERIIKEQFET